MQSGAATAALAIAFISAPAFGQVSPADAQAAAGRATATTPGGECDPNTGVGCAPSSSTVDNDQAIIVTGSRIASPLATSVSPVQVIGAQAIQQSGVTNVQEILLENPAFGSPTFARTNTAFLTS
ncbi:MAG: hypothetical protein EON55_20215, partial [Alphaproteobacteria bacterium]